MINFITADQFLTTVVTAVTLNTQLGANIGSRYGTSDSPQRNTTLLTGRSVFGWVCGPSLSHCCIVSAPVPISPSLGAYCPSLSVGGILASILFPELIWVGTSLLSPALPKRFWIVSFPACKNLWALPSASVPRTMVRVHAIATHRPLTISTFKPIRIAI
jgi:hypothetical protein